MRAKKTKAYVIMGMSQKAGIAKIGPSFVPGRIKSPSPYWFEFGTAQRSTKTGHRTGAMRATPYFRPAVTASKSAMREAMARELKKIIVNAE